MHNNLTIEIARPAAEVFAVLSDQEHLSNWVGGLLESRVTHHSPTGVGTRFHQTIEELGQRVEVAGEVTAHEPPERVTVKLKSEHFDTDATYQVEPLDLRRARVHVNTTTKLHGWALKLMSPAIHAGIQKKLTNDFERLKHYLEDQPA